MADKKISALTAASTPLAGTEVLPIVQSGATVKIPANDLTVRNVRAKATTGILQIAGPTAGTTRTMTAPDADFTVVDESSAQTLTNKTVKQITKQYTLGSSSWAIDISGGATAHFALLNENVTSVSITGTPWDGMELTLVVDEGVSGKTVTGWPANFAWEGLSAPSIPGSSITGRRGIVKMIYDASNGIWFELARKLNVGG